MVTTAPEHPSRKRTDFLPSKQLRLTKMQTQKCVRIFCEKKFHAKTTQNRNTHTTVQGLLFLSCVLLSSLLPELPLCIRLPDRRLVQDCVSGRTRPNKTRAQSADTLGFSFFISSLLFFSTLLSSPPLLSSLLILNPLSDLSSQSLSNLPSSQHSSLLCMCNLLAPSFSPPLFIALTPFSLLQSVSRPTTSPCRRHLTPFEPEPKLGRNLQQDAEQTGEQNRQASCTTASSRPSCPQRRMVARPPMAVVRGQPQPHGSPRGSASRPLAASSARQPAPPEVRL